MSSASGKLPYGALATLSFVVFINITVEMMPIGLMLPMSRDLGVSQGAIGALVSLFAFTVVLSAPLLVRWTRALDRKLLLLIVMVVFGVTCIGVALAPGYWWIVAFRTVGALAHGMFWTVVGSYPTYLTSGPTLGRAVAIVNAGGSIATVLGVPAATLLGQLVGWRWSFGVMGVVALGGAAMTWRILPAVAGRSRREAPEPVPRGAMWPVAAAIIAAAVVVLGHFSLQTLITPYASEYAGLPELWLSPLLLAIGVLGLAAVIAVSIWFGKRPTLEIMVCLTVVGVAMAALLLRPSLGVTVALLLVWGLMYGPVPVLLQTRTLAVAPPQAVPAAMAWYTTGFNVGIGGGAILGTWVQEGWGLAWVPAANLTAVVVAIALLAASARRTARTAAGT